LRGVSSTLVETYSKTQAVNLQSRYFPRSWALAQAQNVEILLDKDFGQGQSKPAQNHEGEIIFISRTARL